MILVSMRVLYLKSNHWKHIEATLRKKIPCTTAKKKAKILTKMISDGKILALRGKTTTMIFSGTS